MPLKSRSTLLPVPSLESLQRTFSSAHSSLEDKQSQSRTRQFPLSQLDWLQHDNICDVRVLASCQQLVLSSSQIQFQMRFKPQRLSAHIVLGLAVQVGKNPGDMIQPVNGRSDSGDFHHEISAALISGDDIQVEWKDEIMCFDDIFDRKADTLVLDYVLEQLWRTFLIMFFLAWCFLSFYYVIEIVL
ncbi:hypothetical protein J3E72DRAFT_264538 [Bipolaris maydis]|nr:hypothetical protein J3E72DRAFT_264538 [Bipolaris maydis]